MTLLHEFCFIVMFVLIWSSAVKVWQPDSLYFYNNIVSNFEISRIMITVFLYPSVFVEYWRVLWLFWINHSTQSLGCYVYKAGCTYVGGPTTVDISIIFEYFELSSSTSPFTWRMSIWELLIYPCRPAKSTPKDRHKNREAPPGTFSVNRSSGCL